MKEQLHLDSSEDDKDMMMVDKIAEMQDRNKRNEITIKALRKELDVKHKRNIELEKKHEQAGKRDREAFACYGSAQISFCVF